MSFMQKQITGKIKWLQIEGTHGDEYVPLDDTGLDESDVQEMREQDDYGKAAIFYHTGDAYDIFTVHVVEGHGCRLSAPGYIDCTDWTVFPTPEECEKHLEEMYGDE